MWGNESAYKRLPGDPMYASLSVVALRCPMAKRWVEFTPRALLFGAVSAVTRYNWFSRIVAVLVKMYL